MTSLAVEPFAFASRLNLTLLTGIKARDIAQLLENIRVVPKAVVYFHTHHFLVQHQFLSPEPPNDFAFWVSNILLEERLGEELAAIDILRFSKIHDLRDEICRVIEKYMEHNPEVRAAPSGMEFHFRRSVSFVLKTGPAVRNLVEFRDALMTVSPNSISFHMFDARLRLERGDNDFSNWIEKSLDRKKLADELRRLDPYTHTEEGLRQAMIALVDKAIGEQG
jgi:hypothetical protein